MSIVNVTEACRESGLFLGPFSFTLKVLMATLFGFEALAFVVAGSLYLYYYGTKTKGLVAAMYIACIFCCLMAAMFINYVVEGLMYETELLLHRISHFLVPLLMVLLLAHFVRMMNVGASRRERVFRTCFYISLPLSVLGRAASIVLQVISTENNSNWAALAGEVTMVITILCAMHSGTSLAAALNSIQRLKGVLAFFIARSILIFSWQLWEQESIATTFRDSFATMVVDLFPMTALLAALWPQSPRLQRIMEERPYSGRLQKWIQEHASRVTFFVGFYLCVAMMFGWGYESTCFGPLGAKLGWPALLARAAARPLILFTPCLILTVMHGALSMLRRISLNDVVPLDSTMGIHVHCAIVVSILTLIHTAGHIALVAIEMQALLDLQVTWATLAWPWTSGWIMFLVLGLCTVSGAIYSKSGTKRCYFPQFISIHQLGWIILFLIPLHGVAQALHAFPTAFIISSVVIVFWLAEFVWRRFVQRNASTKNWSIRKAGAGDTFFWLELHDMGPQYFAGGWIYLSAPSISLVEKHPFTIAMAVPEQQSMRSDQLRNSSQSKMRRGRSHHHHQHAPPHPTLLWAPTRKDFESVFPESAAGPADKVDGYMKLSSKGLGSLLFEPKSDHLENVIERNWELENYWHGSLDRSSSAADLDTFVDESTSINTPLLQKNEMEEIATESQPFWKLLEPSSLSEASKHTLTLTFLIQVGNIRGSNSWTRRLLSTWNRFQEELELVSLYDSSTKSEQVLRGGGRTVASIALRVDGPFSGSAYSLMQADLKCCVLVGMGSGVTAPLGLLSHFTRFRPDVWTSFVFSTRDLAILAEVVDVIRSMVPEDGALPCGGVILHLTSQEDFPDAKLLTELKGLLDCSKSEKAARLPKVYDAYQEWLTMARLMFGRKAVSALLKMGGDEQAEDTLPYNWNLDAMKHLIVLLKNSVFHKAFEKPMPDVLVLRGRPTFSSLCMRLGLAAIMRKSAIPLFGLHPDVKAEPVRARTNFTNVHCLYTGGSGPLKDLLEWVDENNSAALTGLTGVQSGLKAIWKVHGEIWG